ncbi:hypothetical protein RB594_009751 [Gaeumannomyces avenae]
MGARVPCSNSGVSGRHSLEKNLFTPRTPAFEAARNGHAETLELLLLRGADIEATLYGERLVGEAFRSAETVRLLLWYSAKCNNSKSHYAPLWQAVAGNYLNTARVLLDDDIDGRLERCELETEVDGSTVLSEALSGRYDDIALDPLDAGANINWVNRWRSATPLHLAVEKGNEAVVVAKLLQRGANVHARDNFGRTPLNSLECYTPVSAVRALICAGADVESANEYGYTPVWTAVMAGNAAVSRLLLASRFKAKANISAERGSDRLTLLQRACLSAAPDLVEAVVRLGGADVNIDVPGLYGPPSPDRTAPAADITPHAAEVVGLIKMLLENGAELNPSRPSKGGAGYVINAACVAAPLGAVEFLIRDCGARVDVCDSPALRTPLHLACRRDARFIDAVLSGHAALARAKTDPLVTTANRGKTAQEGDGEPAGEGAEGAAVGIDDAVTVTVSRLLGSVRDVAGRLPLHYAAASGKPGLVRHVLDRLGIAGLGATATETETAAAGAADFRAAINDKDGQGWTPLHWAARATPCSSVDKYEDDGQDMADYAAVVRLLIDRDSDTWARRTPGAGQSSILSDVDAAGRGLLSRHPR